MATLVGGAASYSPAVAASSSNNKGDIWIDVSGSTDGPEMDPHLPCTGTLWIWGMDLNDASGPVAIQGWSPSGGGASDQDWSGTWNFDVAQGGQQEIATVDVATLIANAQANGDSPQPQQGFHFKIDLEDPRTGGSMGDDKYKTFWVDCTSEVSGSSSSSTGESPSPTPSSPSPTPSSPSPTPSSPSPTPSSPSPTPSSPSPTPTGSVSGTSSSSSSSETTSGTGSVQGISTSTGGVGGISTPNTGGGSLPLGVSGGLMVAGLGMLAGGRRMRRRRR